MLKVAWVKSGAYLRMSFVAFCDAVLMGDIKLEDSSLGGNRNG